MQSFPLTRKKPAGAFRAAGFLVSVMMDIDYRRAVTFGRSCSANCKCSLMVGNRFDASCFSASLSPRLE